MKDKQNLSTTQIVRERDFAPNRVERKKNGGKQSSIKFNERERSTDRNGHEANKYSRWVLINYSILVVESKQHSNHKQQHTPDNE